MRRNGLRFLVIGGVLLAATGCSTGWEWTASKTPPTDAASVDHLTFVSARTRGEGSHRRVKGDDIIAVSEESRSEGPVTVGQDQILEP